jgi:hypothetical protein
VKTHSSRSVTKYEHGRALMDCLKNEINYILSNRNIIRNFETIQQVNIGSNLRMVPSKTRLETRVGKPNITIEALMNKAE